MYTASKAPYLVPASQTIPLHMEEWQPEHPKHIASCERHQPDQVHSIHGLHLSLFGRLKCLWIQPRTHQVSDSDQTPTQFHGCAHLILRDWVLSWTLLVHVDHKRDVRVSTDQQEDSLHGSGLHTSAVLLALKPEQVLWLGYRCPGG